MQSLGEWMDIWINECSIKNNWETSTRDRAQIIIIKNIKPRIGHIPLTELEKEHIVDFYNILSKDLSLRSFKYVHTVLNQSLNEAVESKKITANPIKGSSFKLRGGGKAKDKWVVLDAKQLNIFLDKCQNHRDYALIFTAAYTGARESELLGLTWDRVQWDIPAIYINHTLHYNTDGFEYRPRTKNDSSERTIKISQQVIDVLRKYKK